MTDTTTTDQDEVERLRAEMVERLVLDGYLVDGAVRRAMRTVVSPTHVGMGPPAQEQPESASGEPHARGDGPSGLGTTGVGVG